MTTPTPVTPLSLHQHQQAVLDCVCEAMARIPIEVPGLMGCPCRKFVSPGQPAADACDAGCSPLGPGEYPGQLTVHINRMFATDSQNFPRRFSNAIGSTGAVRDLKNCQLPQVNALDLYITVFRCLPVSDTQCPPSASDLSASSLQLSADMLAVQQGLSCCYSQTDTDVRRNGRRFSMGDTYMIGPSGGCIGFRTEVTVAIDGPFCCPSDAP